MKGQLDILKEENQKLREKYPEEELPAWGRLVHPLALRLIMFDVPCRSWTPSRWQDGRPGGNIDDLGWNENHPALYMFKIISLQIGETALQYRYLTSDPGELAAELVVKKNLPQSFGSLALGRKLIDIIQLPLSGDTEVDAAVQNLRVHQVDNLETGVSLKIEPAPWISYGSLPSAEQKWWQEYIA